MRTFRQGHALVVGIGEYQDAHWSAPIARSEAQAVAEALRDPGVAAYPPEQVHTLLGAAATRDAIIDALRQLDRRTDADSTVLLYLCGHGERSTDGSYAFAAHDTVFTEDNHIAAPTGISSHELLVLLRAIRARKLVCFMNACFAGNLGVGFSGVASPVLGTPPGTDLEAHILASGEGRVLITAGRASQPSHYLFHQPYTFFGQAVIEGLRGVGVPSTEGYIGLFDLYNAIHARVTQAAASINSVQEPMLTVLQGVGPFPLALHPGTRWSGGRSGSEHETMYEGSTAPSNRPHGWTGGPVATFSGARRRSISWQTCTFTPLVCCSRTGQKVSVPCSREPRSCCPACNL